MLSLGISSCVISAKVHRNSRRYFLLPLVGSQAVGLCQTPNIALIQKEAHLHINLCLHSGCAVNTHLKHIKLQFDYYIIIKFPHFNYINSTSSLTGFLIHQHIYQASALIPHSDHQPISSFLFAARRP